MEIKQKYLKKNGTVALVTVLGMAPPLSTDMYMPSLPNMAEYFHTSPFLVNMTLISFFLFMAIGTLLFGPVSDREGRRKTLLITLGLYGISSLCCAVASNIWFLITVRVFQGLGAGGMISVSIAVIKDCFSGSARASALAAVQSISVIAPIAAPVIGALILKFASWRAVFVVLFVIAALCFIASLLFEESIHEDEIHTGTIGETLKRITVIGKRKDFMPFLISVSFFSAPFMAYIAVASYIYQNTFGLTASMFSLFFAANAVTSMFGPVIYLRLDRIITPRTTMAGCIAVAIGSAVCMFTLGKLSPELFLLTMIPFSIVGSYIRPFSTNLLFDQIKGDTGSASALMNFLNTLFGSAGMLAASLPWRSYIDGVAGVMLLCIAAALITWIYVLKDGKVRMKGIHE